MITTGGYATAAVLPSAWKSIMYRVTAMSIVSRIFMDAALIPMQFIDGSLSTSSLRASRFFAIPVIPARAPGNLVDLLMV